MGLLAALLLAWASPRPAMAGESDRRIAALTTTITTGSTDKARLAAVTALAGMSDRRTLSPLVTALGDPSELVRAVAASALGKLGAKAALPALRMATEDSSATVRSRARDAYGKVCKANRLPNDLPAVRGATAAVTAVPAGKAGFGTSPRAVAAHPNLYVVLKSSSDDSAGKYDKRTRKLHSDHLLAAMAGALHADGTITSVAADARRYGLTARHLDLSVTKLEQRVVGATVEIEAQLRLSISDDTGRMLAFVSGGAIVNVARRYYVASNLPQLRREALDSAVGGVLTKLVAQLRRDVRS